MTKDPLSLLGDLPDFPGKTPPRNRPNSPKVIHVDDLNGAKPTTYIINGVETEFFTIGELAKALGRKPVTVRKWESQGWIPTPTFRTPPPNAPQIPGKPIKGRRLYTKEQVVFLIRAVNLYSLTDKSSPDWIKFREYIKANWPR